MSYAGVPAGVGRRLIFPTATAMRPPNRLPRMVCDAGVDPLLTVTNDSFRLGMSLAMKVWESACGHCLHLPMRPELVNNFIGKSMRLGCVRTFKKRYDNLVVRQSHIPRAEADSIRIECPDVEMHNWCRGRWSANLIQISLGFLAAVRKGHPIRLGDRVHQVRQL